MDFFALADQCSGEIDRNTLYSIIKTESNFSPFVIGVNGEIKLPRQPESKEEAVFTAKWLLENGYNIDLGLGQINSLNLGWTGLSVEDVFDPCKNIEATAFILRSNYDHAKKHLDEKNALYAAISAYNTGSFSKGFSNGYVGKVLMNGIDMPLNRPQTIMKKEPDKPEKKAREEDVFADKNESTEVFRQKEIGEVNVFVSKNNEKTMVY